MAETYTDYNRISNKMINTCEKSFLIAIENKSSNLINHKNIIVKGRDLAQKFLDAYYRSQKMKFLYKILEIHCLIINYYPRDEICEMLTKIEIHLVQDKCKFFIQSILVMFHLNEIDSLKVKLTDFKNHLHRFSSYIKGEFKEKYQDIKDLLRSFIFVSIVGRNGSRMNIYNRIGQQPYELLNDFQHESARLQSAVIIGSCETQVSVSGLTIDMFRMSQASEANYKHAHVIPNARQWLFYNKSFWDVEIGINDAIHNIPEDGILLLYVSGNTYEKKYPTSRKTGNSLYQFGIKMKHQVDVNIEHPKTECLYPGDIATFLVVPTVLIVDSRCSEHFQELHRHTDDPFICLLSPAIYPNFIKASNAGNLFTLFLTSPQTAFCWICERYKVDIDCWEELVNLLNDFMLELSNVVEKWCRKFSNNKLHFFMGDSFCRAYVMRYFFCMVTLRLHNAFYDEQYYPRSNMTKLESEILSNKKLQSFVYSMASAINTPLSFATSSDLSFTNESIDVEI